MAHPASERGYWGYGRVMLAELTAQDTFLVILGTLAAVALLAVIFGRFWPR